MKLREWNAHLHGLVVFRTLLNDPVVARLLDLTNRMEAGCSSYGPVCDAVAAFEAALFEYTTNWGSYLSNAVLEAETICVRQAAAGQLDALLQSCRTARDNSRSASLTALWRQLLEDVPFTPVCFKSVSVLTTADVVEGLTPTETNPFHDLGSWVVDLTK